MFTVVFYVNYSFEFVLFTKDGEQKTKKSQISIAKATIKQLNFGSYKVQGHSVVNIH